MAKKDEVVPPTAEELAAQAQAQEVADLKAMVAALTAKLELAEAPKVVDQDALPGADAAAKAPVGIPRKWETHDAVRVDH